MTMNMRSASLGGPQRTGAQVCCSRSMFAASHWIYRIVCLAVLPQLSLLSDSTSCCPPCRGSSRQVSISRAPDLCQQRGLPALPCTNTCTGGWGGGGVPWTPERATPVCPMLGITDRLLIGSRHQASREWMNLPALLESLS